MTGTGKETRIGRRRGLCVMTGIWGALTTRAGPERVGQERGRGAASVVWRASGRGARRPGHTRMSRVFLLLSAMSCCLSLASLSPSFKENPIWRRFLSFSSNHQRGRLSDRATRRTVKSDIQHIRRQERICEKERNSLCIYSTRHMKRTDLAVHTE